MPGDGNLDNDDYVAKLLAEDAKRNSVKYATAGLSAFLPSASRRTGPKPNTRFLNHLVRDVDSHNTALKRKEEQETAARIEGYRRKEREDERARALDLAHTRRRKHRISPEEDHDRSSKRRRRSTHPEDHERKNGHRRHRSHRHSRHENSTDDDERTTPKSRREHDPNGTSRRESHRLSREQAHADVSDDDLNSQKRERKSRSARDSKATNRPSHRRTERAHSPSGQSISGADSGSDPLEALVGPLPPRVASSKHPDTSIPARVRGRGALAAQHGTSSSIDAHFSPGYDPSTDTGGTLRESRSQNNNQANDDDWDLALSALRDRTAWKEKQSIRLREAGFTDEEIRRWERGSGVMGLAGGGGAMEGDVSDVRWVKRGEDREWDRGKERADWDVLELEREGRHDTKSRSTRQDGWGRSGGGLLKSFTSALKH